MVIYLKIAIMELYNQLISSVQNKPEYLSRSPPSQEVWQCYVSRATELDVATAEALYATIIHHHYITYNVLEALPYGIKKLSATGGVVLNCVSLPVALQYIVIAFLENY
jgi:hypothetical protein